MSKKPAALLVCVIMILSCAQLSLCQPTSTPAATVDGWEVLDGGGHYSQSNGELRLWTEGGGERPYYNWPYLSLLREFTPTGDFSLSMQVKAEQVDRCGFFVRGSLPIGDNFGFNLEFARNDSGGKVFLVAKPLGGWNVTEFATGRPHVWYTMQLTVTQHPFLATGTIFDEQGQLLASYSTAEMDFSFEDIKYIALGVWGYTPSDYTIRNIQVPGGAQNDSSITIFADCSSKVGSAVNIYGTLTDSNNAPLENKTVVLSYNFPGVDTWIPISSCQTTPEGKYNFQWINSASGTFTLKTEWSGDAAIRGSSNTTTLSFLPSDEEVFVFESNSTVSALAFDSQSATLTFNVTGPSNTTGYVRATVAKALLAEGENLQASIDGRELNYTVTSTDDAWVYIFNYSHSTHQISMQLNAAPSTQPLVNVTVLVAIVIVLGAALAVIVYAFSRRDKPKAEEP